MRGKAGAGREGGGGSTEGRKQEGTQEALALAACPPQYVLPNTEAAMLV